MPVYACIIILIGIAVWFYPFIPAHQTTAPAAVVNRRSRWGVLLQFLAFTLLWQGRFWTQPLSVLRLALCILFFSLACVLSWTSAAALAGQLRVDAALGADHHLVRSGPYRLVRNPIYLSMLLVLCAVAVVVSPWQLFVAALIIFLVGTEIRVRTEEKLLVDRFGDVFNDYKRSTPAYIPFLLIH